MKNLADPRGNESLPQPSPDSEFTKSDEYDIDIATGLMVRMMMAPEGIQSLNSALAMKDQVGGVAAWIGQAADMIMTHADQTDIPMNPFVWLADGGVVDEVMPDLAEIAENNGTPVTISEFLPRLKEKVNEFIVQLANQQSSGGEGNAGNQPVNQGAPLQ